MINGFLVFILSIAYMGILFTIAYAGDQKPALYTRARHRSAIYSLTLAVYCTSWTFYGAVGTASVSGLSFLPIYLGPALIFLFGHSLLTRMITVSKRHNSTSIADFIATRYGKSQGLAAFVSLIALIGTLPYIALQLKAVSMGFSILTEGNSITPTLPPLLRDTGLYVALAMTSFTVLFGTRHLDATEHHHGLMLTIAFESAVKLLAFIAVGLFALWLLPDGPTQDRTAAPLSQTLSDLLARSPDPLTFGVYTLLAALAIFCLPRQFHVMVVENHNPEDMKTARWAFPAYLLVLSAFVVPLAIMGVMIFPDQTQNPDTYILALPLIHGQPWLALIVFIGGASAATSMVIMSAVTLSTMVSNEILVPLLLKMGGLVRQNARLPQRLLNLRRTTIAAIIAGAYLFSRITQDAISLASIGLLSFVAVAQFAPALIGGLYWKRGNCSGAIAGMATGFGLWVYTLLIPAILRGNHTFQDALEILRGLRWLNPEALLGLAGLNPIVHGTLFSLSLNALIYVLVSLITRQRVIERIQVASFHDTPYLTGPEKNWISSATLEDLMAVSGRFLGEARSAEALKQFRKKQPQPVSPNQPVTLPLLRHMEAQLAGVIGSSSARVVLSTALQGQQMGIEDVVSIVDEASQVMRFNRERLQSAIENMHLGVSVIDHDLNLVAWNKRYLDIFSYPKGFVRVGRPIAELLEHNLKASHVPDERIHAIVEARLALMRDGTPHEYERIKPDGSVILIQGTPMPDGGFVTCFSDITRMRKTEQALKETNTYLEHRVQERTEELSTLNEQLSQAKSEAEQANLGKTRFLASASHDLLQPLNAARLFASALNQSLGKTEGSQEALTLLQNLESSLNSAEDILHTLLDISKLDAGAIPPQIQPVRLADLFKALATEFGAIAQAKGLEFRCAPCALYIKSDPQLLRRVLQNFLSNAVRYTRQGRVLLGARRRGDEVRLEVWDTGPGIPVDKQQAIFQEFKRLESQTGESKGLGLGLAIAERIARLLGCPIEVRSQPGHGSVFSMTVARSEAAPTLTVSAPSIPSGPMQSTAQLSLTSLAVLCIDNEPSILSGLQALLSGWGCKVWCAASPDQARQALTGFAPAIILADYQLEADVDGLALLNELCDRSRPPIQGVLITAVTSAELRESARALGYHFLNKPVKPAALRALLSSLDRGQRKP
ncbi:MAG: hybrid sensor histidine kinase/response regulator [Hahellaceae bacterium]|nr:hybrid sensor histidine kinase/response regulator [Hahellaceae bacterium]